MTKKWLSDVPKTCQICNLPFGKHFIDGKTAFGPWALMCEGCHRDQGYGLGVGRGQKYDTASREMVEGGSK